MTTEIIDAPVCAIAAYSPFYAQLAELEKDNSKLVFDYADKKGNKDARSHIHSLRLTKGALERVRKEEKEESLRIGKTIDAEAKEIAARIEAMIAVHQTEIDRIEQIETDRIAALEVRLNVFSGHDFIDSTVAAVKAEIAKVEAIAIDDTWQEFTPQAARMKDAALTQLRTDLADYEKRDSEAAELARLRAEAEARAQKDRDDAIAAAAVEQARIAEEQRATAAAEAAKKAIADAEAAVIREKEAAAHRELELKLQAEQSERRRLAEAQAAALAVTEAAEKAEKDRLQAIAAEQSRVAAVARAEAEAAAKREANTAHRAKINRTALAALVAGGMTDECAKLCVTLIASGKVPAISISY